MFEVPLASSAEVIALENFWSAVFIYHDKPHVVNRRLAGVSQSIIVEVEFHNDTIKSLTELFTRAAILYEARKLKELSAEFIKNLLEPYDKNVLIHNRTKEDLKAATQGIFVSLRILLPRQSNYDKCCEIVAFDKERNTAHFFAVNEIDKKNLGVPFPYLISFKSSGEVGLLIENFEDADTSSAEWLSDQLFPKLLKWAENYDESKKIQDSLSLISHDRYCELYQDLKAKHGKAMEQKWTENTDPLKFIYEDVAIASYLIALWEKDSPNKKPSFVDLGCGNGLLVFILNEAGYEGFGIDVRKRKLWDVFPKTVRLEVRTLMPSALSLFPDTDWIIGNHSDELTPWIPVIAARSSQKTKFFLLPCCSYEFNGKKYQRYNTSKSQYNEYLEYVETICNTCGFKTEIDKLKIPSTKRICLVGTERTYKETDFDKINAKIAEYINKRCNSQSSDCGDWVSDFEPRAQTERVKNCTHLNKDLIDRIVHNVVNQLLGFENFHEKLNGEMWNAGGNLPLPSLIKSIAVEDLKQLKSECGGLQTLLKNHRYIFEVASGSVQLRKPPMRNESNKKLKSKLCWFHANHPDSCWLDTNVCACNHIFNK